MNKTVLYSDFGFQLTRDDRDDFFLSVLVETAPHRRVTLKLNSSEVTLYLELGEYFVRRLALDVCREPERFAKRMVDVQDGSGRAHGDPERAPAP